MMSYSGKLFAVAIALIGIVAAETAAARVDWKKSDIRQMVIEEADRQHFPAELALAVARVESNFDPLAVSSAGARGVMQIMPATAEDVLGVSRYRLYEPRINIRAGISFLDDLIKTYDGRWDIALSHYNGGSAVKNRRGRLRVIPATQTYVDTVLDYSRQYAGQEYDQTPTRRHAEIIQVGNLDDFQIGGIFDPQERARHSARKINKQRSKITRVLKDLVKRNKSRSGKVIGALLYDW